MNMKNDSQSGVSSLNAPRMRGESSLPELRSSSASASSRPARPREGGSRESTAPTGGASSDVTRNTFRQVIQAGPGPPEPPLLLDRGGLGVALHHDQPLQAGPVLTRHLLPDRL